MYAGGGAQEISTELESLRRRVGELEGALAREAESRADLVAECERAEEELRRRAFDLEERVKELRCLYGVSRVVERQDLSLEEMLKQVIEIVPSAWRYPEIACARIILRDAEYRCGDFHMTEWVQASDIFARGEKVGAVEVYYLEERPGGDGGPFQREESDLLNALAERLGESVERMEMEEALRESEERYRLIYDFTGEAIYTYDTEFILTGVNRKACEFIGYTREELLGCSILELGILHTGDYERTLSDIRRLLEGEVVNDELRFIKKDGSVAVGDVTGAPMYDRDGRIVAFTNVARDITEKKKADEDLRRINRELDAYAHVVSHDLRGPISIVISASDALREMLARPLQEDDVGQIEKAVEIIRGSADAARRLVEDLLSLAQAGHKPEDLTRVEVRDVVQQVLAERSAAIKEKKVRVELDEELGRVIADPTHIYQLFSNLVSNAVNHNDNPEPRLAVRYERDETGIHRYTVWDNGPGISPEDREKVFAPLFRRAGGGTGVGLTIVRKVVDIYGGEIRVHGDGGASFEFSLRDGST